MIQKLRLARAGARGADLDNRGSGLADWVVDVMGKGRVPLVVGLLVEWRRVGEDIEEAVERWDAKSVCRGGIVAIL